MKKIFSLFLLIMLLVLPGCINETRNKDVYYSFTDSNNKKIVLSHKPKNVAILFSSYVEIYNIAGGKTKITVQESIDRNLVDNDVILVDDGAGKTINTEILIAANPDFVIGSSDINEQVKTCQFLNDLNIPSALFKVESFDDYLFVLDILTDITGFKDCYKKYGLDIKEKIDSIKENINNEKDIKILFIRSGSSISSCKAKNTNSNFVCKMLKELGTINIADTTEILLDGLSIEEILLNEPDYIFISIMGDIEAGKKFMIELLNSKTYSTLNAVKNKKYYFLPKDLFQYKPNHKWEMAYQYLVDILYENKK